MYRQFSRPGLAALLALVFGVSGAVADSFGLDQLRAAARAHHPTLVAARAAVDSARAALAQRRAIDDPVASFTSGRADGGDASGNEWSAAVSQRVPLPGLRRQQVLSGEAAVARSRLDQLAIERALDLEVGRLWAEALLAGTSAEVGARSEEISRRLLELVEQRVEAGEAAPLERVRARTEWFARRQLAQELRRRLDAVRAALDIACGRSLGRDFALAGRLDSPRALPELEALRARLEASNPQLRALRAQADEVAALAGAERRAALGELELSLSRESELDKEATGGGIAWRLPLWNRNRAGIAAADAQHQAALAAIGAGRLELGLALEATVLDYRAAAERLELYDEGWRGAAAQAVEITEFSYRNGESSLLELLDAQRSLLEVGLAEAETRARLTIARLQLERLLGPFLDEVETDDNN